MSRRQSDFEAPSMKYVSVAVLPPRLPAGMAPPSGVAAAGAMGWDEAVNWQHNEPANAPEASKTKQFMRKAGLTTQRARKNPELPPFTFRQVPYDTWRKHYAKDAEGNYRGTHAPAEDCLLKEEDVQKWRFAEQPTTNADKWTRGTEVLPVYAELDHGRVPDYEFEHQGIPPEPVAYEDATAAEPPPPPPAAAPVSYQSAPSQPTGKTIADGKTAAQIIEEAKAKAPPKMTWKEKLRKGAEMAMMGN